MVSSIIACAAAVAAAKKTKTNKEAKQQTKYIHHGATIKPGHHKPD
jgi:hypothetical protein